MRLLPVSVRGLIGLAGTLIVAAPCFIQVVDQSASCTDGVSAVVASPAATQNSAEILRAKGVVLAIAAPSARTVEQGVGAHLLMFVAELITGGIAVLRPRFLDLSQEDLLRTALGNLATR